MCYIHTYCTYIPQVPARAGSSCGGLRGSVAVTWFVRLWPSEGAATWGILGPGAHCEGKGRLFNSCSVEYGGNPLDDAVFLSLFGVGTWAPWQAWGFIYLMGLEADEEVRGGERRGRGRGRGTSSVRPQVAHSLTHSSTPPGSYFRDTHSHCHSPTSFHAPSLTTLATARTEQRSFKPSPFCRVLQADPNPFLTSPAFCQS